MTLQATNTTCDIYRGTSAPPADPNGEAVPCLLQPSWRAGQDSGERDDDTLTWTHILLVDLSVDIRDNYEGAMTTGGATFPDWVYVPDQNGTKFRVSFVERVGYGTANDHKRVFLDRFGTVSWPTNNL